VLIKIPGPGDKDFQILQGAPLITLSHISNSGQSVNVGYSVEWFDILERPPATSVTVRAKIGVGDSDGLLRRVGYHVTLVGEFVDPEPVI